MKLIRKFTEKQYEGALASWSWLPLEDMTPFSTSQFGDIFFDSHRGIFFLDIVDGELIRLGNTKKDVQELLNTDAQQRYLWAEVVAVMHHEGIIPGQNEIYDFEINPVLGGEIDIPNIKTCDFEVAVNMAGQIHKQVRDLPPGSKVQIKFEN